ncbi:hypothetical protein [Aurantimonas sp. VKM B-3413]|uniref:hypothetical protein n=1 Tax=Aurantimonas sp. VKM B-3413 TaxID=2779401 RepID=UPI001E52B415|nr:hypothetical protein [Aurantimonas sp. VKM B-3413]MCB8836495.1 hypothetical protein [Aurantimonas sp. VKM B-3413]
MIDEKLRYFVYDHNNNNLKLEDWSFVELDVQAFYNEWKSRDDNGSEADFTGSTDLFWSYLPEQGINVPIINARFEDHKVSIERRFLPDLVNVEKNRLYVSFSDGRHRFYFFRNAGARKMVARCRVGEESIMVDNNLGRDITSEVRDLLI